MVPSGDESTLTTPMVGPILTEEETENKKRSTKGTGLVRSSEQIGTQDREAFVQGKEKQLQTGKDNVIQLNVITLSCLYAETRIDGALYYLLVDSGSSVSIISKGMSDRLGITEDYMHDARIMLLAANGTKLDIMGEVEIEFAIDSRFSSISSW